MSSDRLVIIGTGHSESIRFWNTNCLVESGGQRLLLDCGYTIKFALRDIGLELADIDAVFITHLHADHCFGLERMGFESRYKFNKRIKLFLEPDLIPILWDECLKGCMGYSSSGKNSLQSFFDVVPIEDHRFEYGNCRFETFTTPHMEKVPSYGVMLNDKVAFTSDTRILPWLKDAGLEVIIHDCTLQDSSPVHSPLREIQQSYPAALKQRILLIHYEDNIAEFAQALAGEFLGIAYQGQEIPL